jgi:deoxyhypusine synthase
MIPADASAAVLKPSDPIPDDAVSIQGPNFDNKQSFSEFMGSYERIGFQASSFGAAIKIVNKMVCAGCVRYVASYNSAFSANGGSQMSPSPQTSQTTI